LINLDGFAVAASSINPQGFDVVVAPRINPQGFA
jgi:hypothetical protein